LLDSFRVRVPWRRPAPRKVVSRPASISPRRVNSAASLEQAPQVRGLAHMLSVVIGDADQADAQGYRWVPGGVDHTVEIRIGEAGQVGHRAVVYRLEVIHQGLRALRRDRGDLGGRVAVAGVRRVVLEAEAGGPVTGQ